MKKIILVTGATSGFGKAIAEKFSLNGYSLIITGRREDRLLELADTLTKQPGCKVLPLNFDVRNKEQVFKILSDLPAEWRSIDVLVNNAGLALGRDFFDEASIEDWDTMIDTNVKGLLYVSRAVLPYMIPQKKGHIINIGSIAGKEVYEKGNVYCGTKYAVDAISQAMRIDMLRHGIKITAIHPGAADTEFSIVRFKGNEQTARKVYEGYEALQAGDIADICFYCASLPPHVCINDMIVTCTAQANATLFYKQ